MSGTTTALAAVIELDAAYIIAGIIIWIVTQVVSAAVSSLVTIRVVQREQIEHQKLLDAHADRLAAIEKKHSHCQLDARDRYAGRRELTSIIGENRQHYQSLMDRMDSGFADASKRIDETHTRITSVAERLSALEGSEL